jgi:hypothetical protein
MDNTNFRPVCKHCGSPNTQKRGRNQWQCSEKGCKKYFRIAVADINPFGGFTQITAFVPGMLNDIELMQELNIDATRWKIAKVQYDRKDTYKGDAISPMVSVKVTLAPKVAEIAIRELFAELLEEAKGFSPKYPKITYPKLDEGVMYEISMPDIHLGLLAWAEESGTDSDLKLTEALVNKVTNQLIAHVKHMPVSRILFPIGNDYFNVNDKKEETIHGTRQQEDTRWQKTFRRGHQLMVQQIDKLQTIAPVDVPVIPGNHDEERAFYMGEVLSARYRNCPNVTVDNRAVKRKYYAYGVNLIGLTHGYYEKPANLCNLMPLEVPQLWAASKYREFHLGDKHHKKDILTFTEEFTGVTVRITRALSAASTWAFDKGFLGALRAGEGFVWHPTKGLIAQYTAAGDL